MTLDVTTHSSSLGSLARFIKKRIPYEKRRSEVADAVVDAPENGDETEAPVAPLEHDGLRLKTAPATQGESLEKIQLLELHSKNPLVSYQGKVYSCTWSKPLGTDVLLKVPSSVLQGGLQDDTDEISPIVAWSDLRLMAKPVDLVPYGDHRAGKDNVLADGTRISSPTISMHKDESMQQASFASQPSVQAQKILPSLHPLRLAVTSDLSDQQSTSTHLRPTDQTPTPPAPQTPESAPSNHERLEYHRARQSQRIPTSAPSPCSLSNPAIASATLDASSVNQEVAIPAILGKPQPSDAPSNSSFQPSVEPSNTNNTVSRELSPGGPVTISLAEYNTVPRRNQASFLSRLIAAKRSRGETDDVTIYAKKSYYGTGWRAQQQATKEKEARRVTLVEEDTDGSSDTWSNNEHEAPVSTRQRQAKGRVRSVGFTKNGKKIGRPRTEAFGSGRGRGRGRGMPRMSRGGRGVGNAGAGSEVRRADTRTDLDMQAMEVSTDASPDRVDDAQELSILAGDNPEALAGADGGRTTDHSAARDASNQEWTKS